MRNRWSHEATDLAIDAVAGVIVIHFALQNDDADRSIELTPELAERLHQEIGAVLPPKQPRAGQR